MLVETRPRICIPIHVKPEGGMYTFVGNLLHWLERHDWPHTADLDGDFDVLFVNSWVVPPSVIKKVKRSKPAVRVLHRIDGAAADYGSDPASDGIQARVNLLADVTVFQSEYSKHSTREKFLVISQNGPVIYNPVDVARFAPEGTRRELPQGRPLVACASWSVNRRKGTWQIEELAAHHPEVVFVLCGRFDAVTERPNVIRLGHLTREDMAATLRSCDMFLNLSENDPCPNVVLEALASGLPVLYLDSGGVPELVDGCGLPVDAKTFTEGMARLLADRPRLSLLARQRAVLRFAPDTIFPQYIQALSQGQSSPASRLDVLRLARAGYPVLPSLRPAAIFGQMQRRAPAVLRRLVRGESNALRVGWVTYDSFPRKKRSLRELDSFTGMRVGNVARWINAQTRDITNELYHPDRRYDVVVFQKMMDARCQAEAETIQAHNGKVIFDANVNYYETWGDYFVPGTRPTAEQHADAIRMTAGADLVVADSSYLAGVIHPINVRVSVIPDNVDMSVYGRARRHCTAHPVRLVWSGIAKKAVHLLSIVEALAALRDVELVLVVDTAPECLSELERAIRCRVVKFSDRRYARTLAGCDIMLSPKRLINAYEMAHTEYKISLGMGVGLPAVASPQPSYVEAIGHRGGGIVADTLDEWRDALIRLVSSPALRGELGGLARQTVLEQYATPVIAARYEMLLRNLSGSVADAMKRHAR
jgi:glycosyltransferase involved in cell wall biosynthesis